MAPDFNQRVRQVFDEALDRPESERLNFVKAVCEEDRSIYQAVERLLRASENPDTLLDATLQRVSHIGRYIIRGELGRGAMGTVYDAVDPMIGRRVAVKVITLKNGRDSSETQFIKECLFREARSAGRLLHTNIVLIFDVGLHEGSAFITMELVDGPSLQQVLAKGPVSPETAIGIIRETAAALDCAHQNGVIHRDIKPANILLTDGATVKVADFGIAKLMSQTATLTGIAMGTPSYMSPEQIEIRPVDGRSDQFSLAVLAFELLTGQRPFQADSMATVAHQIVYGPRPSAHAANPSLPEAVDPVLTRALRRAPEERFANCTEFASSLATAVAGAARPAAELAKRRSAKPFALAAAVIVLAAIALATIHYSASRVVAPIAPSPATTTHVIPQAAVNAPAPTPKPTSFGAPGAAAPKAPKLEIPIVNPSAPADAKSDSQMKSPVGRAQDLYTQALDKRAEHKPDQAAELFRQAAEVGNADAMEELGESYRTGEGVTQSGLEAERWFLRAAVIGNSNAMVSLGGLYLLGDGVEQNDKEAAKYFQRATDAGNSAGMYDLASLYEEGRGVPRDANKARQLYEDSAALGDAEAKRRLAAILRK